MISPEIFTSIQKSLTTIEQTERVQVLYACESGSRAWVFASSDSDYDVRFIYVHPRDHYLSVFANRDVIEQKITDDLDVSGWDLQKTLGLLSKSNPPLLEWLKSPIVYQQDAEFATAFRSLLRSFTSGTVPSSSVSDASLQTLDRVLLLRASLPFVGLLFRWAAADALLEAEAVPVNEVNRHNRCLISSIAPGCPYCLSIS